MSFTKISSTNIANGAITFAQTAAGAFTLIPTITNVQIADASYNVLDDTAANTGGGYVVITGSNFGSNSQVIIGTTNATSTTYVNSTTIRAQVPALSAATYSLYVVDNTTGATAIKVNGLTYSSFPAWSTGSTLTNQQSGTSFGINVSASSDSNITYANTTALPTGTTLAANGYFSGTVTVGSPTTYSFDVKATDVENQDATRTFSLTVILQEIKLWSWGLGNVGQLGINTSPSYRSSPVQIGAGTNWYGLGSSSLNHFAIKDNGTLWSWGGNQNGANGLNDIVYRSSPTQVGSLTNWSKISAGDGAVVAIKTDGTMWSWGWNAFGQLGLNNGSVNKSSPTQIGSGTNWSFAEISGQSGLYGVAIKTDGTLWSWGLNNNGQLGVNNRTSNESPVQVGAGTNWSKVTIAMKATLAIKTDGTLWSWGDGSNGCLADNNFNAYRSSPVQVGAGTTWSLISAGAHVLAIKTDGTLWSWGQNASGQLGQNDVNSLASPRQIGTDTSWSKISAGSSVSGVIKTNGTLWIWGGGTNGQLGLNDSVGRSSPVQVGTGTNWSQIMSTKGSTSMLALTLN
jgi:hypothetical protein